MHAEDTDCTGVPAWSEPLAAEDQALVSLGKALKDRGYRFTAITPKSHRRAIGHAIDPTTLEAIFGWHLPFLPQALDPALLTLLDEAGALERHGGKAKASVRFASLDDMLFVHSGYPTHEQDAVFFGPDTYRFARALRAAVAPSTAAAPLRLIDIGCGSGAGGLFAGRLLGPTTDVVLADINRKALAFSGVNAAINDCRNVATVLSDVLDGVEGEADIIIANPPYLIDADERLYRHGGGDLGISLAVRIAEQSLKRLRPGGRFLLYTGVPIIRGADPLFHALRPLLQPFGGQYSYEEVDPDVFGEELARDVYATADRIAVITLTVMKE
jgi:SAM-dependent methyltransferase